MHKQALFCNWPLFPLNSLRQPAGIPAGPAPLWRQNVQPPRTVPEVVHGRLPLADQGLGVGGLYFQRRGKKGNGASVPKGFWISTAGKWRK